MSCVGTLSYMISYGRWDEMIKASTQSQLVKDAYTMSHCEVLVESLIDLFLDKPLLATARC